MGFVSEFEIQRQIEVLENGGQIENETRYYDAETRCVLCVSVCVCACVHACVCVCACIHACVCMCVCVLACMPVCACVCVYVSVYKLEPVF